MVCANAVGYALKTFDPRRAGSGRGVSAGATWDELVDMRAKLIDLIPAWRVRVNRELRPKSGLTYDTLAAVVLGMQVAMHDGEGEVGAVPRAFIMGYVANTLGTNPHTQLIPAVMNVLVGAGMVEITRLPGRGRCRMYQLTNRCPLAPVTAALPAAGRCVKRYASQSPTSPPYPYVTCDPTPTGVDRGPTPIITVNTHAMPTTGPPRAGPAWVPPL